jgi:hypothetical protein
VTLRIKSRRNKHGNKKVVIDNIKLDSIAEGKRYVELKLLERAGEIQDLKVHPRIVCIVHGIEVCTVVPDFSYWPTTGLVRQIYEDVKGFRTQLFILKKALVMACHGIDIKEIKA